MQQTTHNVTIQFGHRFVSLIKSSNNLLIETNGGRFFSNLQKVCYTSQSMAMRGVIYYTPALLCLALQACHGRFCYRFIEENEPSRVELNLLGLPFLAACFHIGPVLLTRS